MASNDEQKKALTRAVEIIEYAYSFNQRKFAERQYFNNMYHNYDEMLKEKAWWQTKFAHPFPFFTIEMKASFYREGVFGADNQNLWEVKPENAFVTKGAKTSSKLINYQLTRTDFEDTFYMGSKDLGIFGDWILETYWNRKEKYMQLPDKFKLGYDGQISRPTYDQLDPNLPTYPVEVPQSNGGFKIVRVPRQPKYVLFKNQPDVRTVYINSVWPDPKAISMAKARYICIREEIPFQELKAREQNSEFINVDQLKGTDMPKVDSAYYDLEPYRLNAQSGNSQRSLGECPIDKENQLVEVVRIIYTDTGEQESIGNRTVYLGRIKPFLLVDNPLDQIRNFGENGKFWGQSDFRAIANHWRLVNQYQNLEADNVLFHHRGYTILSRDAGPNAKEGMENLRPGSLIITNNQGAISHNQPTLFSPLVLQSKQDLINQAQQSLGLNEILAGATPSSNVRSSEQFSQIANFGAKILSQGIFNISKKLQDVGAKFLLLNQEFLDIDQKVSILGPEGMEELFIAEDTLPLNPHITVRLSADVESQKNAKLQQLMQAINLAGQAPGSITPEMIKDWFTIQGKFDNPEKYFAMSYEESRNFARSQLGLPPDGVPQEAPGVPMQSPKEQRGPANISQEPALAGATRAPSPNQMQAGNANTGMSNLPVL